MNDISYLSLKLDWAEKVGPHARGKICYRVLTDLAHQELYFTLVANEGSGWFSPEIVPFTRVEAAIAALTDPNAPMMSRQLRSAFNSRSTNNAGFLAAVLRAEGLLVAVPSAANQHLLSGDWAHWQQAMVATVGESYVLQPPMAINTEVLTADEEIVGEEASTRQRKKSKKVATMSEVDIAIAPDLTGDRDESLT